jgi:hypothetical protein
MSRFNRLAGRLAGRLAAAGAALAGAALLAPAAGMAQLPAADVAYSADSVVRVGGMEIPARVYHDQGRERREMTVQGMEQTIILRPDLDTVYVVMPMMNMGFEVSLDSMPIPRAEDMMDRSDLEEVGRETVAGLDTTKYRIVGTSEDGMAEGFVWISDENIPVRVEGVAQSGGQQEDFVMYLENIEIGPQDPALFERPAGVSFMPIDPAMMGPMMGSGDMPGMPSIPGMPGSQ